MTWEDVLEVLRSLGQHGDTELAHVTPEEKRLLEERGGAGTTNPATGLPEFYDISPGFGSGNENQGGQIGAQTGGMSSGGSFDLSGTLPDIATGASLGTMPNVGPSGSAGKSGGFGFSDGMSLMGMGSAAALGGMPAGPMGMLGPMVGGMISNARGRDVSPDQMASMAPGGALAVALGHAFSGFADLLGLEKQGQMPSGPGVMNSGSSLGLDPIQVAAQLNGQPAKLDIGASTG